MSHFSLLSLFYLFLLVTPGILECGVSSVRKCPFYSLISKPDLHVFIPKDQMDETCNRLMQALSCAYEPNVLGTCDPMTKLPFDTQRGVIETVCVAKRKEYARSARCFNSNGFKERLFSQCIKLLATVKGTNRCLLHQYVSRCSADLVMDTDGCLCADADYMEQLVRLYILPTERILSCDTQYARSIDCYARNNTTVKDDPIVGKSKDVADKEKQTTTNEQGIGRTEIENTTKEITRNKTRNETRNETRNNTSSALSHNGSSCPLTTTAWTSWSFHTKSVYIITVLLINGRFSWLATDNWRL